MSGGGRSGLGNWRSDARLPAGGPLIAMDADGWSSHSSMSWLDTDPSEFDPFADPLVDITRLGDAEASLSAQAAAPFPDHPDSEVAEVPAQSNDERPSNDATLVPEYYLHLDDGRRIPLDTSVSIGRVGSAELVASETAAIVTVEDPTVSREHILVEVKGGAVSVRDLGSTNGSAVLDGVGTIRLEPGVDMPLRFGDRVRFGDRSFVLELGPAGDSDLTTTV